MSAKRKIVLSPDMYRDDDREGQQSPSLQGTSTCIDVEDLCESPRRISHPSADNDFVLMRVAGHGSEDESVKSPGKLRNPFSTRWT